MTSSNIKKKDLYPIPDFIPRDFNKDVYDEAIKSGISPFCAKIIANRKTVSKHSIHPVDIMNPTFRDFNVWKLKDIEKASERIAQAVVDGEVIGLLCDFDVDGISSAAVLYSALNEYFGVSGDKIKCLISNRMIAGYGFSSEVVERIFNNNKSDIPTLLITADQGSKDGERVTEYVNKMKSKKMKGTVIITDHHHIPPNLEGLEDAYAVINPQRKDCEFPDKTVCGCTVALMVMVAVREKLIKLEKYKNIPKLTNLLTYSTAATIADCVSMASPINRAIVKQGLKDIDADSKAAWEAVKFSILKNSKFIRSSEVAFGIAPRINACSRTGGDGLVALKFYLSSNVNEAMKFLGTLEIQNDERKITEKKLVTAATEETFKLISEGYNSLVIKLDNGHHGVHGIAASRICERFGRPVIIFSPHSYYEEEIINQNESLVIEENPKDDISEPKKGLQIKKGKKVSSAISKKDDDVNKNRKVKVYSGSARSIEGINVELAMRRCSILYPDLIIGFGGHDAAAGLKIKAENFDAFKEAFETEIRKMVSEQNIKLNPKIYYDGVLKDNVIIDCNFLDQVIKLEPYGNGFENPIFKLKARINAIKMIGQKQETAKISFRFNNINYEGLVFRFKDTFMSERIKVGDYCDMGITVDENYFNNIRDVSIKIVYANSIIQ